MPPSEFLVPMPPPPLLLETAPSLAWSLERTERMAAAQSLAWLLMHFAAWMHQGDMAHSPPVCSQGTSNHVLTGMTKMVSGLVRC